MSLMEQAINVATDTKNEERKKAKEATRARGKADAEWMKATFGLDEATWVASDNDTEYEEIRDFVGIIEWKPKTTFRHRIKVDDVLFGLTHGRYGSDRKPTVEVVYIPCPTCGDTYPQRLAFVSSYGDDVERHRASLLKALGAALIAPATCNRCRTRPCSECGKPR